MYIQGNREGVPFSLPKGYSGSAFAEEPTPPAPTEPTAAPAVPPPAQEDAPPQNDEACAGELATDGAKAAAEETAAAPAFAEGGLGGGLFGRLPFLSHLLPPAGRRGKKDKGISDLLMLGIVLLLLFESEENDLLPLLILLLLWD